MKCICFFQLQLAVFCLSYVWKQCGKFSITVTAVTSILHIFLTTEVRPCRKELDSPSDPRKRSLRDRFIPVRVRTEGCRSCLTSKNPEFQISGSVLLDQKLATLVVSVLAPSQITSVGVVRVLYEALDLRECILVEEVDVHHQAVFSTSLGILLQCK